jgi:hypothetical protein
MLKLKQSNLGKESIIPLVWEKCGRGNKMMWGRVYKVSLMQVE